MRCSLTSTPSALATTARPLRPTAGRVSAMACPMLSVSAASAPCCSSCSRRARHLSSIWASASAVLCKSSKYTEPKGPCEVSRGRKRSDCMSIGCPPTGDTNRSSRQELPAQRFGQPFVEPADLPAAHPHQPVEERRIHGQPDQIDGLAIRDVCGERIQITKPPNYLAGIVEAALLRLLDQGARGRIHAGSDLEGPEQRAHPLADRNQRAHDPLEQDGWVGLVDQLPHRRAIGEGDRLIVARNGPIERDFQQVELAPVGGEHGLSADPGGLGDRIDRRWPVTVLDKESSSRTDDGPPGSYGLGGTQLGAVSALDRGRHFR